ncbi:hypothetical protein OA93_15865 [Flavobacterium sp. KMS]|uniref:hypothetical protein n=1 Tax=Flavobacterium sp. KMS TaxID=1566023 RepID=UPI00057D54A6|nr:hypothetical protein [Flavobacterium sp. KMS]KIA97063.1 hypothetical protein OA93_15865 [Flavobacterium sp. KMS]
MKDEKPYYFIVTISIFVSCCSSTKDKYNALNNYFETIVTDSIKEVIVIKEKDNPNLILDVLKTNQINAKGVKRVDKTFFKEKNWEAMKKKYGRIQLPEQGNSLEDEFWTKDDFRHKRIIIENYKTQNDLLNKYLDMRNDTNYEMYFFSDPIYYHKKKIFGFCGN